MPAWLYSAYIGLMTYSGQILIFLLFLYALMAAVYDARTRQIPNWLCWCIAVLGICIQVVRLATIVKPSINATISLWPLFAYIVQRLPSPQICLLVAFGSLLLGAGLELARREFSGKAGMGMGDIKYIAAWATVLGYYVFPALALGCLFGAVWALGQRQHEFALGPWLSLAFLAALFLLLFAYSPQAIPI